MMALAEAMRGKAGRHWLLVTALLVSGLGLAPAATAVTTSVPCDPTALVAAMNAANASVADDTLDLASGCLYALTVADNASAGGNGLPVIANAATAGKLTLNGNAARIARGFRLWLPLVTSGGAVGDVASSATTATTAPSRVSASGDFRLLMVGSGGNLTLNNLTLANGSLPGNNGGGILNAGTLALHDSTLAGNAADFGGGIYNSGTLTVTNSTFSGNTADGAGGGINSVGALTVSGSAFAENSAGLGDGILVAGGTSSVTTTSFTGDSSFTCPAFPHTVAAGDTAGLISTMNCANSSLSSDVINLTNSTYTLAAVDNTVDGPDGLPAIANAATAGALTLNGNGATLARSSAGGTPDFRILSISTGGQLALDAVTIHNGSLPQNVGGGIFNIGTLLVSNSHLTGNAAIHGGGIMNVGTLTVSQTTFTGNTASGNGGGLLGNGGVVTVSDSTFTANAGTFGGGIHSNPGGTLTVMHSSFLSNTSTNDGAGINSGSVLALSGSLFSGNVAAGLGGGLVAGYGPGLVTTSSFISNSAYGAAGGAGMLIVSGAFTVTDSLISNNYAEGAGGGLFNVDGVVLLSNSTIVSNTSGADGGALFNAGVLTVTHSTITGNRSTLAGGQYDGGGGLVLWDGTFSFGHTLIAGNTGYPGPDIRIVSGTVKSLGYNILGDSTNVTLTGSQVGNLTGGAATPLNLGPLQNNGGPTLTMALLTGSVAIDAGDPAFSPPPTYDQRGVGFPRVVNIIDIGAYEKP